MKRNPFAALVSGVAALTLAFGLAPVTAFASPDNLTAAEVATRLASRLEPRGREDAERR